MNDGASDQDISFNIGLKDAVFSGWYNQATGELFSGFPIGPHDIVLDVGCGTGGMDLFSARRGAHVILVDANADNVAAAKSRVSEECAEVRVEAHVSDANPLPLADGTATRVVCTEVLEHVDDPSALMRELVRVGQPGALYLITVPGTAQENMQKHLAHPTYFAKPNHIRIFDPESFASLIRDAGLRIEHTSAYGFFWSLWMMIFWQTEIPLFSGKSHPMLDLWAKTWNQVIDGRDGRKIQALLNQLLPKSQVIVASKPSTSP
jgi:SAM-dependent methyltransferase